MMTERNILSYFASSSQAEKAEAELRRLGYDIVQVDRINRYPTGQLGDTLYNPMSGQISSLTNLVLGTSLPDDAAILAGSDPSVSGMSANDMPGRYPFILTVVTENEQVEQAVQVIKQHGGYV